ncbi:MAG: formate--tetrahydrofolate ligase [Tissierellia bacterium]|nr:formate--tetrahydrofolate ligase [Tissierellia bacterium]
MKSDIEIAREANIENIEHVLKKLNISDYELYGKYKAKLDLSYSKSKRKNSKLILVTSINPTPFGEGKTTMNISISMALNKIGKNAISVLREPSLGPSFGLKGGACGGGYSQVIPMDEINLHFTGDFHAITSSVNLVSAMIDNHIHQGNQLGIDPSRIVWKRVLDLNDRALREIVVGLGDRKNGVTRQDGFDITVASEMMAVFCLSRSLEDFREKIERMIVAFDYDSNPIYLKDLKTVGSVMALMKDALKPNLVQTLENTPAIIHGGPFANIAHGCNSIIATSTALNICDYAVTEAGFGADLGAEKFFDIKCRKAGLNPDCAVVVASIRALKYHGGASLLDIKKQDLKSLEKGFENLKTHIENVKKYGVNVIVAINRFDTDTEEEIKLLEKLIESTETKVCLCEGFKKGSLGAIDLANEIVKLCENKSEFKLLYDDHLSIKEKIQKVCTDIYRAKAVKYSKKALEDIETIEKLNKSDLPICIAKTQYSLSDDANNLNPTSDYDINIKGLKLNNGAGFIVCIAGNILTMPGLPKVPAANNIDLDQDGNIVGLF